jgi:CubicO group peptidase (beta-lactamase class C family)
MEQAVSEGIFPGGVLLVSLKGQTVFHQAFGVANIYQNRPVTPGTLFDLASLTKPLATTPAVMKLLERYPLTLKSRVGQILPGFKATDKADITIENLLFHNSGLPDYRPYFRQLTENESAQRKAMLGELLINEPLAYPIGQTVVYSDLGFMILRWIVERIAATSLDRFVEVHIYKPLNLEDLFFVKTKEPCPDKAFAATEMCPWRNRLVEGMVHDENAFAVGGVDGQAGLFGTAEDIHTLLSEMISVYSGDPSSGVFNPDIIRTFLNHGQGRERALGFDRPSPEESSSGIYFSANSVGHLGFSGTSFWMDLDRSIIIILLTNRIHPTRENEKIKAFRPLLHDAVMQGLL